MKTACLLFMMMISPTWGAAESARGNAVDENRDRAPSSHSNHPLSRAAPSKLQRSHRVPKSQQRSQSAKSLHQSASIKPVAAGKGRLIPSGTVHNGAAVRTPNVARPAATLAGNVRHRGANPAAIGGSSDSPRSNTGTINGAAVNRRR